MSETFEDFAVRVWAAAQDERHGAANVLSLLRDWKAQVEGSMSGKVEDDLLSHTQASELGLGYAYKTSSNALGTAHVFTGPGLHGSYSDLMFLQGTNEWAQKCLEDDGPLYWTEIYAKNTVQYLYRAFRAGQGYRSQEIRKLINHNHG